VSHGVHVRIGVGSEAYAVPVEHVLEVAELGSLSPVPGSPRAVLGVRNLRGDVLPVVDLAAVLEIEREGEPLRFVVAKGAAGLVGLAVDTVTGVGPLTGAIEEAESSLLSGTVLEDGDLVGLLDVDRLIAAVGPRGVVAA
jgi:purine-binding chemotaxis protein CheW